MSIVYRGSLSLWHTYFSRKFPVYKHFSGSILKDHPQNFNPLGCSSGWWSCPWLVKCWFFDPDIGWSSFLNGTCLPRLIWNHVSPTQTTLQPQKQLPESLGDCVFFAFQEFFTCQGPTSQAWKCPRQSLVAWDESEWVGFFGGKKSCEGSMVELTVYSLSIYYIMYKNIIHIYKCD